VAFGELHEIIFAWLSQIRAICYLGPSCLQHWPEVRTQSEDRNASARQVLFVLDALISRDKEIKTGIPGGGEKLTVFQRLPMEFDGRGDGVALQEMTHG